MEAIAGANARLTGIPSAASEGAQERPRKRSRWIVANVWCVGLVAYVIAIAFAPASAAVWINDSAWTLASLFGCLAAVAG